MNLERRFSHLHRFTVEVKDVANNAMDRIKDTFGMSRVLEPSGSVPVTAWKVDSNPAIDPGECRIDLKAIYIEADSFQQLCSSCGHDDIKVKGKIIDIVNKRGKLHNPFTDSGGVLCGMIAEMGIEYAETCQYSEGDMVLCNTTTTAIPICIEEIENVDYRYGIVHVKGHGIIFRSTPIVLLQDNANLNLFLSSMDEAASLYSIYNIARVGDRTLIIARDTITSVLYLNLIREATNGNCSFTVVIDESYATNLPEELIKNTLSKYTDSVYICDISHPVDVADMIIAAESEPYDLTVNCEDMSGAEILAVLLTKTKGQVYFTSIKNNYSRAILFTESLGKEMIIYDLDQFIEGYEKFTLEFTQSLEDELTKISETYSKYMYGLGKAAKRGKHITISNAGKAGDFIFASPITESLIDEAINIANYDCNVILQGETGTGKEKILSLIHNNSKRNTNPCVKINCATIQENLAESEFFGYEPGAFTGAQSKEKQGYFDMANGGILFLDEIGTLSMNLQSKLLRVLQEGEFYRVGGTMPVSINVRVICANNFPIRKLVEEGKFREDLYYRLNICTIDIPPLRDRPDDIPALAEAFMDNYCKTYGTEKRLDEGALRKLASYDWPGNVRELENLIHRIVINTKDPVIGYEDVEGLLNESVYEELVTDIKHNIRRKESLDFNAIIEEQEKKLVTYALQKCKTTRKAAEFLNMTQAQLMRKKQKYDINI